MSKNLNTTTALLKLEAAKHKKGGAFWNGLLTDRHEKSTVPQDLTYVKDKAFKSKGFSLESSSFEHLLGADNSTDDRLLIAVAAVMAVLIHKFTSVSVVSFGIPNHLNNNEETLISPVLIIKIEITKELSVRQLLNTIKNQWLEVKSFANYPLDVLDPGAVNGGSSSLYDIVLSLNNIYPVYSLNTESANVYFELDHCEGGINGTLMYNCNAYSTDKVESLVNYFKYLPKVLFAELDTKISNLEVILPEEKEELFSVFNNTQVPIKRDKLFLDFFKKAAQDYPTKIAAKDEISQICYLDLECESNQVANFLISKGLVKGDRVVIIYERSVNFLITLLGVLKSGGVFVALDLDEPISRVLTIIKDAEPKILFANESFLLKDDYLRNLAFETKIERVICIGNTLENKEMNQTFHAYRTIQMAYESVHYTIQEDLIVQKGKKTYQFSPNSAVTQEIIEYLRKEQINSSNVLIACKDPILELSVLYALEQFKNNPIRYIEGFLDEKERSEFVERNSITSVFIESQFLSIFDSAFWQIEKLEHLVLLDGNFSMDEKYAEENMEIFESLANKDYIQINDYGWYNSFNGESFSEEEMLEYIDNVEDKILPFLSNTARVLEIGCGQGLIYNRLLDKVNNYLATDPSATIIAKNIDKARVEKLENIAFEKLYAHEIDQLEHTKFDVVICSSVTDYFPNTIYFENVVSISVDLIESKGIILFDDVLNLDKKQDFMEETSNYKKRNPGARTKTRWDADLFVSGDFFEYLKQKNPNISAVEISKKQGTVENELTKYRFDILIHVDKLEVFKGPKQINKSRYCVQNRSPSLNKDTISANKTVGDTKNWVLDFDTIMKESKEAVDINLDASDLCYLIYSSGTTGTPKGIKLHHLGMINHFVGFSNLLNLTSDDCIAQTALCSFDVFVVQTLLSLINGGRVLFVKKSNLLQPETFFKILKSEKVTVIELVPSLIKTMLNEINLTTAQNIDSLRFLISTGEQLTTDLCDMWFSKFRHVPIVNAYGPAETSDDVTAFVIEKAYMTDKISPIGKPLENIHVYVVDQFNQLTPQGVQGEICISGICVGMGYLNDPKKTKKVFVNNPFVEDIEQNKSDFALMYKTGDLGVWEKKGFLKYKGRRDFMVKIRGVRIELAEIEIVMMTYEFMVSVCVTDILNNNEKVLCAYFEASKNIEVKRFDTFLRKKLPSAMIPSFFIQLDDMPYSRNGKIDRKKLPSPFQTKQTTALNLNDTFESGLLSIWKEVLKIAPDSIGQESDFFFIGGHSLAAIRLVSSIKKKFDVKISLEEVFKFSIFSDLVELIRTANKNEQIIIPKAVVKPYYLVSPPQRRFYIHNQIYPSDLSYNSTQYYKIEGELDFNKVQSALKSLVDNHEILKTSFHLENNSPVQKIDDTVVFEASYIEDDVENIDQRIKDFVRPFNLNEAPLIRANVIKCSNKCFFLLFDAHHIISDEISDNIIVNYFLKLYAGQSVSPPILQYKDYSEWFNKQIDSGRLMKHEQYWLEQFKTIPPKLSLPYDSFEKVKDEKFGQDIKLSLTNIVSHEIREILKNSRVTAFMFFIAVFNAQLKKLTFSDDIAIGSPVSGRENDELNVVVGLFLNLIVLRTKLSDSMSFEELLEEVKKTCINALTHQTYPFDMLTAKLGLQGELDKTPLYSVMFAHLTKGVDSATTAEINIETYAVDHNTAKADLQFTIFESEENFEILLTVNTNLFSKETAIKLTNNYNAILELIIKDPSILLKDIPLPTEFDFLNGDTNLNRHELSF